MPDVLKIAKERRAALLKEVSALDRFIDMANVLLASVSPKDTAAAAEPKPRASLRPAPVATRTTPTAPPSSETEAFLRSREQKPQNSASHQGSKAAMTSGLALG